MPLEPSSTPFAATVSHDVSALDGMDPSTLRTLAKSLMERIAQDAKHSTHHESQLQSELQLRQARIDALTVEIRLLRHLRFGAKTEAMDAVQAKLFEEANAEDLGAAMQQLAQLGIKTTPATPKARPTRQPLPANFARVDIAHEPENTTCGCGNPPWLIIGSAGWLNIQSAPTIPHD